MKTLYILRHAKSSWAQPGLGDIERPLNPRGLRQSENLHHWFSNREDKPNLVLCSPSVRTRQTWTGISKAMPDAVMEIEPGFYHGVIDAYLASIWGQDAEKLMIVGHNPTCDELARYLTAPDSPAAEKLMAHHFGTATLAIFECEIDKWSELGQGSGNLIQLLRPKELSDT